MTVRLPLCLFQDIAEKIEEWEQLTGAFTANLLKPEIPKTSLTMPVTGVIVILRLFPSQINYNNTKSLYT